MKKSRLNLKISYKSRNKMKGGASRGSPWMWKEHPFGFHSPTVGRRRAVYCTEYQLVILITLNETQQFRSQRASLTLYQVQISQQPKRLSLKYLPTTVEMYSSYWMDGTNCHPICSGIHSFMITSSSQTFYGEILYMRVQLL